MWRRKKNTPPPKSLMQMKVEETLEYFVKELGHLPNQRELDALNTPLNLALRAAGFEPGGWLLLVAKPDGVHVKTVDHDQVTQNTTMLAQALPTIFSALSDVEDPYNTIGEVVVKPEEHLSFEVHVASIADYDEIQHVRCGMSRDAAALGPCGGPLTNYRLKALMANGEEAYLRVCEQHEAALGADTLAGFEQVNE